MVTLSQLFNTPPPAVDLDEYMLSSVNGELAAKWREWRKAGETRRSEWVKNYAGHTLCNVKYANDRYADLLRDNWNHGDRTGIIPMAS